MSLKRSFDSALDIRVDKYLHYIRIISENIIGTPSDDNKEVNMYANIKAILYAYDDVYVYQNYNGTYGLLSTDGDIIHDGFNLHQTFSENSNYISCYNGKSTMNAKVFHVLDKNGKTVLEVGKDNVEFISEISQGRILVYKMTDERPSGKTYDLICYSAKDMSEVFRIKGVTTLNYNIYFDEDGYAELWSFYEYNSEWRDQSLHFDINGNKYRYKSNRTYVEMETNVK